ncbi:hypothetical protein ACFL56_00200 [Candidatus Margulisiibacteriota bacterium]
MNHKVILSSLEIKSLHAINRKQGFLDKIIIHFLKKKINTLHQSGKNRDDHGIELSEKVIKIAEKLKNKDFTLALINEIPNSYISNLYISLSDNLRKDTEIAHTVIKAIPENNLNYIYSFLPDNSKTLELTLQVFDNFSNTYSYPYHLINFYNNIPLHVNNEDITMRILSNLNPLRNEDIINFYKMIPLQILNEEITLRILNKNNFSQIYPLIPKRIKKLESITIIKFIYDLEREISAQDIITKYNDLSPSLKRNNKIIFKSIEQFKRGHGTYMISFYKSIPDDLHNNSDMIIKFIENCDNAYIDEFYFSIPIHKRNTKKIQKVFINQSLFLNPLYTILPSMKDKEKFLLALTGYYDSSYLNTIDEKVIMEMLVSFFNSIELTYISKLYASIKKDYIDKSLTIQALKRAKVQLIIEIFKTIPQSLLDEHIVLFALNKVNAVNVHLLYDLIPETLKNKKVTNLALQKTSNILHILTLMPDNLITKDFIISKIFYSNESTILEIYKLIPDNLKNDTEIIFYSIKKGFTLIPFYNSLPGTLKNNKEIIIKILENINPHLFGDFYKIVPQESKTMKLIKQAIHRCPDILLLLEYIDNNLINNLEIIKALENSALPNNLARYLDMHIGINGGWKKIHYEEERGPEIEEEYEEERPGPSGHGLEVVTDKGVRRIPSWIHPAHDEEKYIPYDIDTALTILKKYPSSIRSKTIDALYSINNDFATKLNSAITRLPKKATYDL